MSSRDPTPLAGPIEPLSLAADPAGLGKGFSASIGKKYLMGWTGLFWCTFLLAHLAGNLAIYAPAEALNAYAAKLAALGPLLYVAEAGLVVLLLTHVILAVLVTLENSAARPVGYEKETGKGGKTWASRTMIWTGLFVLGFFIVHLLNIKFATHPDFVLKGETVPDIHQVTMELFQSPIYVVFYLLAVSLLGLHVSHGFHSALRTIGVHGKRITPKVEALSVLLGFVVAIGYGLIPIWSLISQGGGA